MMFVAAADRSDDMGDNGEYYRVCFFPFHLPLSAVAVPVAFVVVFFHCSYDRHHSLQQLYQPQHLLHDKNCTSCEPFSNELSLSLSSSSSSLLLLLLLLYMYANTIVSMYNLIKK